MDEIKHCRRVIELLEQLHQVAEPHEQPEILSMIKRRKLRLGLLQLQVELESNTYNGFDPLVSRKLDAIGVLLER